MFRFKLIYKLFSVKLYRFVSDKPKLRRKFITISLVLLILALAVQTLYITNFTSNVIFKGNWNEENCTIKYWFAGYIEKKYDYDFNYGEHE